MDARFFQRRHLACHEKNRLGEDRHEGIDEDGQTGFFHELYQNLFEVDRIIEQDLRRYDLNIVQHWNAITEQRNKVEGTVFNMKYSSIFRYCLRRFIWTGISIGDSNCWTA